MTGKTTSCNVSHKQQNQKAVQNGAKATQRGILNRISYLYPCEYHDHTFLFVKNETSVQKAHQKRKCILEIGLKPNEYGQFVNLRNNQCDLSNICPPKGD